MVAYPFIIFVEMAERTEKVDRILKNLPDKPGCYQFYDAEGKIIYVGKAKSLKKRVSSYFTKQKYDSGKTAVLVRKIADIKPILVETEYDAQLLENSLIKKYQPRYNIQWRDDKSFPFIRIRKERFPRVHGMRNPVNDGSEYYGPYASVKLMNGVLDLVAQLYSLRNCNYVLSEENIKKKKFRLCLEYHVGNCKGPCEGLQSEVDYNVDVEQIRQIIKGDIGQLMRQIKPMMNEESEALNFERAQLIKQQLSLLKRYQAKSTVVSPTIHNVDVFTVTSDEKAGYVNFLKVLNGAIVQGHTIELKKKLDESDDELLQSAITELRQRFDSGSKELLVPFIPDMDIPEVNFRVPQRGDKLRLMELSLRNAKHFKIQRQHDRGGPTPAERSAKRILETLQKDLSLKDLPDHIECFDNSNLQGSHPVAACVVFKNAKASKKDYRHFIIRTVEGPDDFASMEEVIQRRYKRLVAEDQPLPQLIVIDGGKGQLSAAVSTLERLGIKDKIAVIGIAKKLEEIYRPGDSLPLHIDKRSESLKLIQQLRNEAHRFGIAHHRKRRAKGTVKSELSAIPGIGPSTVEKLLLKFKSVKRVREADPKELAKVIGKSKAGVVKEHFS